jgi:hypothetical protein
MHDDELAEFLATYEMPPRADEAAGSHDWSKRRNPPPLEYLTPFSQDWLVRLPAAAFPRTLIIRYPRIINLFAMLWKDRVGCSAYFDELFIDRRGGRKGFPAAVKRELIALRDYYWYSTGRRLADCVP